MTKKEFNERLEAGYLILDGATGSNMMKAGMPKNCCAEQWIYEHPDAILDLQKKYVEAGSDIIYAPTFSANPLSLAKHGLKDDVEKLNHALVGLSKQASGGRALVAGDITTTGQLLEPLGDLEYEDLLEVYKAQITALAGAGVDLLVAETMMAIDETLCVLDAAKAVCDLPVMCTLTVQADGSLFFGGDAFTGCAQFEQAGAVAVGCNCSVGPGQLVDVITKIKSRVNVPVIAKPNAGMPKVDEHGNAVYDMEPDVFAADMMALKDAGATILGGCCGTTPEFIRAIRQRLI